MALMVGVQRNNVYGDSLLSDINMLETAINNIRKHRNRVAQLIDGDSEAARQRVVDDYGVVSAYVDPNEVDPPATDTQTAKYLFDRLGTALAEADGGSIFDLRSATIAK